MYSGLINPSNPTPEEAYVLNHPQILIRRRLNPKFFNNVNHSRSWLQRGNLYNYKATPAPTQAQAQAQAPKKSAVTLEGLSEQAYNRLITDKARESGLNYVPYRGDTLSAMPELIRRARERVRGEFNGVPYSRARSRVAAQSTSLPEGNADPALTYGIQSQVDFNKRQRNELRKQFRGRLKERFPESEKKEAQNILRSSRVLESDIKDIEESLRPYEERRKSAVGASILSSGKGKLAKRKILTSLLEKFGRQQAARSNLALGADRAAFEDEKNINTRKAAALQTILDNANQKLRNPDLTPIQKKLIAADVNKAFQTYRTATPIFRGAKVAEASVPMRESYDLLQEEVENPMGKNYEERKALRKSLVDSPGGLTTAIDQLPDRVKRRVAELEERGRDRLRKDLGIIAGKYIRLGQHNSPAHQEEALERQREIDKELLTQRNKIIQSVLQKSAASSIISDIQKTRQLNVANIADQEEFKNRIANIYNFNRMGSDIWGNVQRENEEAYKNYLREINNSYGMSGGLYNQRTGLPDLARVMGNTNVQLENLGNLDTAFREVKKQAPITAPAPAPTTAPAPAPTTAPAPAPAPTRLQRQDEQARQTEQARLSSVLPDWSAFNRRNYSNISGHDLAQKFYRSQHPDVARRARIDSAFHNNIDAFLGYPNQNLVVRS